MKKVFDLYRWTARPTVLANWFLSPACILISFAVFAQKNNQVKNLSVTITNVQASGKTLSVGMYRNTDQFPEFGKYWKNIKVNSINNTIKVEFEAPYGDYAVAVFHDLNGNGKLDKNFIGYPIEPFGFSNNFKPKFSSPSYKDCKFTYSKDSENIYIKLID